MMKFYANLFELTAGSISAKSIRRLRWLTIGSLPYLPMIAFLILHGLPRSIAALPIILGFILCSVLTITVLFARIVNRVWAPDKYLDEWEKELKRKSMTMAFMVMMCVAMAMAAIWGLFHENLTPYLGENLSALPLLLLIALIGTGLYTQIFTQLAVIKPMEEDELEKPEYVVTTARSILGIIALSLVVLLSGFMAVGFYAGHKSHSKVEHAAAKEACGDVDVDRHKNIGSVIEVTCEGSEDVISLDPETLKPIQ